MEIGDCRVWIERAKGGWGDVRRMGGGCEKNKTVRQTDSVRIDIMMRRVRETIVALEKQ